MWFIALVILIYGLLTVNEHMFFLGATKIHDTDTIFTKIFKYLWIVLKFFLTTAIYVCIAVFLLFLATKD